MNRRSKHEFPASPSSLLVLVAFVAGYGLATPFAARAADGVAPDKATFSPGQETKIADPATGGVGWYVVYVPKDYTPDRDWPTMICYHGKNNDPKSWPFKELTDGKGYIVIGMEYLDRERPDPVKDLENLKRIRTFVGSKLRINSKLLFMGGFSQGGWSTSRFSDAMLDELAGLVILGAGGGPGANAEKLKGKPVFVGIGETDEFNKNAKDARDAYERKEATVTFEEFKGLGHSVDTNNKPLKDWLVKWGPQNQMIAALTGAKAAEKAGKLGEAFNQYAAAGKMSGGEEAAAAAKRISDAAEAKIAEAEAAVTAKKYPDAIRTLSAVAKTYAGSPLSQRADERVKQIQTDPSIKADVEQAAIDTRADEVESQAAAAEKAKDYAKAMSLYESYVTQFPKATRFATVKARHDALKADPAILASAKRQTAERECKAWLAAADTYLKINQTAKAKTYLQQIIDKHGSTEWAAEAKKRLATIK